MSGRAGVRILAALAALFAAFTVGKALLNAADDEDLGTPATADLLPLPPGSRLVDDRTYQGEGSLGGGRRVLVVDVEATGQPAGAFAGAYLDQLAGRGWQRDGDLGALSPDSRICLTAVTMTEYLDGERRPEDTKGVLRRLARPAGMTAVVTAIYC